MAFYRGDGGAVWEIDPPDPAKYPHRAEAFAAQLSNAKLTEITEAEYREANGQVKVSAAKAAGESRG